MRRWWIAAALAALLLPFLTPLGAADRVWFVPWRVLEPGAGPDPALFVLYWIPESPDDLKRSDLINSQLLTIYSSRCVAMHIVRVDDLERLASLEVRELPAALLFAGNGEIARLDGPLRASEVETMVGAELESREVEISETLEMAKECIRTGERARAISLYRQVAGQRCAFPRHARTAEKALRRLR